VATRWLAEFEAKVATGERRERTLDLYRCQLRRHLLPRLGRRRVALITPDDVVAVLRELEADGLSPWTIKGVLGALSCVFSFASAVATSARTCSAVWSGTSARIHSAPSSACSASTNSADCSPPAPSAIDRCSRPVSIPACVSPRYWARTSDPQLVERARWLAALRHQLADRVFSLDLRDAPSA